nr:hypothetical protein [uncultured Methanospirillum sp.]
MIQSPVSHISITSARIISLSSSRFPRRGTTSTGLPNTFSKQSDRGGQGDQHQDIDIAILTEITPDVGAEEGEVIHVVSFLHFNQGIMQNLNYGIRRENRRHHPPQAKKGSTGEKKIKFIPFDPGLLHN